MAKPDKETLELLAHKINWEGFDYCFTDYSSWEEIKDEKFRTLYEAFINSRTAFIEFLENEWKISEYEGEEEEYDDENEEEED